MGPLENIIRNPQRRPQGVGASIRDFLSPEAGQRRTKWLNDKIGNAADYYLGPTGLPDKIGAVNELLNPVQDMSDSMAAARDGRYLDSAISGATVLAPVAAGKLAKGINPNMADDAAQWLEDALTGVSVTAQGAGDAAKGFALDEYGGLGRYQGTPEYAGQHSAPTSAYKSTLDNPSDIFPDDIYTMGSQYYGAGEAYDGEAIDAFRRSRGDPDKAIIAYRAVPKDVDASKVNPGDWVTTTRQYAVDHGESALNGDYKIIKKQVRANDLVTDGNSIHEFGYAPLIDKDTGQRLRPRRKGINETREEFEARRGREIEQSRPRHQSQAVLDLLTAGRASEVTDDMLAGADDMYLFNNYDLPMDEASRLARAKEMGFDTGQPAYHGTKREFDRFDLDRAGRSYGTEDERAIFLANSPQYAEQYAEPKTIDPGSIMPVLATDNLQDVNWGGAGYSPERMAQVVEPDAGFDGTNHLNIVDRMDTTPQTMDTSQVAITDPTKIRSRFARFDPRLKHLANLSAAGAGAAVMSDDDMKQKIRQYLKGGT